MTIIIIIYVDSVTILIPGSDLDWNQNLDHKYAINIIKSAVISLNLLYIGYIIF